MNPNDTAPPSPVRPRQGVGKLGVFAALVLGAIVGGMAVEYWFVTYGPARPAAQQAATATSSADVQHLTAISPTQSHTMLDVGYFWANLWFAAQKKNWPLASHFFNEARQAVRWTVLIRPVRQLPGGGTVDIKGQFDAIDPSAFAFVQLAIEDQDSQAFENAYKQSLTACQTCHSAAGLPYLRPTIPTAPPTTILSYDR